MVYDMVQVSNGAGFRFIRILVCSIQFTERAIPEIGLHSGLYSMEYRTWFI